MKLKPCPFCGGEAGEEDIPNLYQISCSGCHISTAFYGNKINAIKAWNKRYQTPVIDVEEYYKEEYE